MKRILILSVSAGQGHVRAAAALEEGARRWFPGETETLNLDLLSLTPWWFRAIYSDGYIKMVNKHSNLWRYLYFHYDRDRDESRMEALRRRLERRVLKKLLARINEFQPQAIISTHFMVAQVLNAWRREGLLDVPNWVVVTDFVAHRFWLEPGQRGYFTASEENVFRMRRRGLADENIQATGIPVMPEFSQPPDRSEAAAKFGLDPGRVTLMLMGGGEGVGAMGQVTDELLALGSGADFQLVVLAGKNNKLLAELSARPEAKAEGGRRLFPIPFTREVTALMAASDLVITKAGGLSTSECLAMGKPMVLISPIPGQEELNADYLLEEGAALKCSDLSGLIFRVKALLESPERLRALAGRSAALGKPLAAKEILAAVLAD